MGVEEQVILMVIVSGLVSGWLCKWAWDRNAPYDRACIKALVGSLIFLVVAVLNN